MTIRDQIYNYVFDWISPAEIAVKSGRFNADGSPDYNSLYGELKALVEGGVLEKRV